MNDDQKSGVRYWLFMNTDEETKQNNTIFIGGWKKAMKESVVLTMYSKIKRWQLMSTYWVAINILEISIFMEVCIVLEKNTAWFYEK